MTRVRSPEHIPGESVAKYYGDRATDGNYYDVPGIYTPEQARAWKEATDAVHAKGGFIYSQLWHVGRATHPDCLGGRLPHAPSANAMPGTILYTANVQVGHEAPPDAPTPKEMTIEDIKNTVDDYVHAAKTAIAAGFDGVEVHSANGYLLDQFLCDNINTRTDKYGGSTENRSRFAVEVVDAVAAAIGSDRVGVRFSPFGVFQGTATSDIFEQYGDVVRKMDSRGLAYVHIIRPRSTFMAVFTGGFEGQEAQMRKALAAARARGVPEEELSDPGYYGLKPFRKWLRNTPLLAAGNFTAENVDEPYEDGTGDASVFGRYFISNPDLVERLQKGLPLTKYDRSTFYYIEGDRASEKGFNDYTSYHA